MADKMRATRHNGRRHKSGKPYSSKHNDRNFDVENAKNIDPERQEKNWYWRNDPDQTKTFEEVEREFYDKRLRVAYDRQQEKHVKSGHTERCTTFEEWMYNRNNAPEETWLQIGNIKNGGVSPETFKKVFLKYARWEQKMSKSLGCTFLSVAMHADEDGVTHGQIRKVWTYTDKDGVTKVSKAKALKAAGIERPDPTKPEGRFNNPSMTYDAMCREKFLEVCKEYGIDLETVPLPRSKTPGHEEKDEYIRQYYEDMASDARKLAEKTEIERSELERKRRESDREFADREAAVSVREKASAKREADQDAREAVQNALQSTIDEKASELRVREKMLNRRDYSVSERERAEDEREARNSEAIKQYRRRTAETKAGTAEQRSKRELPKDGQFSL